MSRVLYFFQYTTRAHKCGFERSDIITLDPNKFAEKKQQCFHIGNHQCFRPFVSLKQSSRRIASPLFYDLNNKKNAYPPDTKAFLYYSMSSEKPRIAGELRLRVTSSNDTALFESGWDLLRPDGQMWSHPLFLLPKVLSPLYEKLREDQLIPDDLDRVLVALPSRKSDHRSHFLYTLNDTFIVDFSSQMVVLNVITEQGMQRFRLQHIFTDRRDKCGDVREPYTGA